MVKDESMKVKMNQAIAGAKGTTFVCMEAGSGSILMVIEGEVEFTKIDTGEKLSLEGGETANVINGELSEGQSFDLEWEQDKWDELEDYGLEFIPISESVTEDVTEKVNSMIPGFPLLAVMFGVLSLLMFQKSKLH